MEVIFMREIKTLVVDDEVADQIKENLENFMFHEARLSIEVAKSCQNAIAKINKLKADKQFYDVLIVDMKMDDSEDKGLKILKLSLSSIKIILTALSSIENCISSLKAGAFDYIDKNSIQYDPYEKLKKTIREGLEERLKEPENSFLKWQKRNLSQLVKKYGGKYIAVIDEIVVDCHENHLALKKRVKKKYPYLKVEIAEIAKEKTKRK